MYTVTATLVFLLELSSYSWSAPVSLSNERLGVRCGGNGTMEVIPPEAAVIDQCQFPPRRGSRWRKFCDIASDIDSSFEFYCSSQDLSVSTVEYSINLKGQYSCHCRINSTSPHQQCLMYRLSNNSIIYSIKKQFAVLSFSIIVLHNYLLTCCHGSK